MEHKPLKCELDAYGDFLQALGPEASKQYCNNTANVTFVTEDLVNMRERVFELLQGTPLNVVVFNQVLIVGLAPLPSPPPSLSLPPPQHLFGTR